MNQQNISFIIPAYNCAETIQESIDSILNSNFEKGDEIIIVNDFSTDNTQEILSSIKKDTPTIKIFSNSKNLGCPATRNTGIAQATNPLIFNLDSDNILPPQSIKILKKYLFLEKADIVSFCDYFFFSKRHS